MPAENGPPPKPLADYGEELKKIFSLSGESRSALAKHLAETLAPLKFDATRISRIFTGSSNTVATREMADSIVAFVRGKNVHVPDAQVDTLVKLRSVAQLAAAKPQKRLEYLEERQAKLSQDLKESQRQTATLREQLEAAGRERRRSQGQAVQNLQALRRKLASVEKANWQLQAEVDSSRRALEREQERHDAEAKRGEQSTQDAQYLRRQLDAATDYVRESEAVISEQRRRLEDQEESLRRLRHEVDVLQGQVRELSVKPPKAVSEPEMQVTTPEVGAAKGRSATAGELAQTWGGGHRAPLRVQELNADMPWDDFDARAYISNNYLTMQPLDEEILSRVRDHFSDHFRGRGQVFSGIDVGTGPNLYPALAMLPWVDRITLLERSARNLDYLRAQCYDYAPHWDQFWDVLCQDQAYAQLDVTPRQRFKEAVQQPEQGNLFELCADTRRWALGTMFFVAESITTSLEEFRNGVSCFMNVLNPGAPFAAAFMEDSVGYRVGDVDFPARPVDVTDVEAALGDFTQEMNIHRIVDPGRLVREGHTGMILVCGQRKE